MKSIYSKLIFGFYVTILISFSVAAFVSLRINDDRIERTTISELEASHRYVHNLLENSKIKERNSEIDLYAKSANIYIAYYNESAGMYSFGTSKFPVSQKSIKNLYKTNNKKVRQFIREDILSVGKNVQVKKERYYVMIQKDINDQKNIFLSSSVLILGCIFLTGSIVFLVVADIIVKPINRLSNAIKELANGNYDVRVDTIGEDEISKLNSGFNHMAVQLAKQDETRQKFISDVSHEFQTPLTSIQGFANILKDEDLPKSLREKYANIILYNAKRLSSLAKNMLQLTLLDSEEIVLEKAEFSLSEQIRRIVSLQESQAASKSIEIQLSLPKKDLTYLGDEQRLEQVWTNIVSNAIKYTNEDGLITISVKKSSKEIAVFIEDSGIGMSQEVISHIFERFYREDKARNVEGNGLGLAIVKSIIDLHGGKIEVLSTVDVGTVFIVRLPIEPINIKDVLFKDRDKDKEKEE